MCSLNIYKRDMFNFLKIILIAFNLLKAKKLFFFLCHRVASILTSLSKTVLNPALFIPHSSSAGACFRAAGGRAHLLAELLSCLYLKHMEAFRRGLVSPSFPVVPPTTRQESWYLGATILLFF